MHLVMRRFHSGERAPMLLDESGLPLFWPTLWATVRLRNAGLACNSIKNKLNELKTLLPWEQQHGRDLESEFRDGKLLSVADGGAIGGFAAQKRSRADVARGARATTARFLEANLSPGTSPTRVSKQVHYNRLTTIANYVEFVAQTVTAHRSDRELATAIGHMATSLRERRPGGMGTRDSDDPDRLCPPPALVDEFVAVALEGHPENPFRSGSIQRRNELICRLLFETGIRLGELLSLRLDNIQSGHEPAITVRRTHDDTHDPRAYQPVAKTKERSIDISDHLAVKIRRYCLEDRARTPGTNRHPYLLVTHRRGRTCGQPLSASSVSNKVFGALRRVRQEFSEIHPHSFRHHDNYRFSKAVDEHNRKARGEEDPERERILEGREAQMRAHRYGHRSLKWAEVYNLRHVRESTNRVLADTDRRQWDRARQRRSHDDA